MGILQAILQAMLQGAGPVGYCLKLLKGIISAGCCARYLVGVLFLDPRSLVLYLLLHGRFVPRSGYCTCCLLAFCSWVIVPFLALRVRGYCGFMGVAGSWRCWLLGIAGSWAL